MIVDTGRGATPLAHSPAARLLLTLSRSELGELCAVLRTTLIRR